MTLVYIIWLWRSDHAHVYPLFIGLSCSCFLLQPNPGQSYTLRGKPCKSIVISLPLIMIKSGKFGEFWGSMSSASVFSLFSCNLFCIIQTFTSATHDCILLIRVKMFTWHWTVHLAIIGKFTIGNWVSVNDLWEWLCVQKKQYGTENWTLEYTIMESGWIWTVTRNGYHLPSFSQIGSKEQKSRFQYAKSMSKPMEENAWSMVSNER